MRKRHNATSTVCFYRSSLLRQRVRFPTGIESGFLEVISMLWLCFEMGISPCFR